VSAHTLIHEDEPQDWAYFLALEMALDFRTRGTRDACSLAAARLRLVRTEGERDGIAMSILGPAP